tara:strand:+ start:7538 stop:7708 length:171 start_codon:yes stop_codon:yes gene_type:complete
MRRGQKATEVRRNRAEDLASDRLGRTPQQQLVRLDKMFGKGNGAVKERAKLAKLIG